MTAPQWNEQDLKLIESLKRLTQNSHGMPPFPVERRLTSSFLQLLEDGGNVFNGNLLVFNQWSKEGGQYLSRSCAVRVDDIDEKRRLLQAFFKIESHSTS